MTAQTRTPRRSHHGTEGEYRRGCRCAACTKASTDARRLRKASELLAQEVSRNHARVEAVKAITPTAGLICDLHPEQWDDYMDARKVRDAANAEVKLYELAIKETMGAAEFLHVRGRVVATWKTVLTQEYVRPASASRVFRVMQKGGRLIRGRG